MKSKYYTPSIEEFYIGFEYESLQDERSPEEDSSWSENSIDDEWEMRTFIGYYCKDHIAGLRVKYLDKDDIESLGFIKTTENWNDYWNNFIQEFDWGVIKIRVHEKNRTKLLIYCLSKDNSSRCLFEGIIKNKSELKVLLKQLRIDE